MTNRTIGVGISFALGSSLGALLGGLDSYIPYGEIK